VSTRYGLVLERIQAGADRLDLDDVGAWDEDERVRRLCLPIMCQWGLSRMELVFCGWFLREMSKLMRRKDGPGLAPALEFLVTKWSLRHLDPDLLKSLICHCYTNLALPSAARQSEICNLQSEMSGTEARRVTP
jgi:hypothetical protein